MIQQLLLASAIGWPGVEVNLPITRGVENNRVSIGRPDGIVISGLRETKLGLGAAGQVVNVNLQMSTGVGPCRRDLLPVGRDVGVLEGSAVNRVTLFPAAVVPCQLDGSRLPTGEN